MFHECPADNKDVDIEEMAHFLTIALELTAAINRFVALVHRMHPHLAREDAPPANQSGGPSANT